MLFSFSPSLIQPSYLPTFFLPSLLSFPCSVLIPFFPFPLPSGVFSFMCFFFILFSSYFPSFLLKFFCLLFFPSSLFMFVSRVIFLLFFSCVHPTFFFPPVFFLHSFFPSCVLSFLDLHYFYLPSFPFQSSFISSFVHSSFLSSFFIIFSLKFFFLPLFLLGYSFISLLLPSFVSPSFLPYWVLSFSRLSLYFSFLLFLLPVVINKQTLQ